MEDRLVNIRVKGIVQDGHLYHCGKPLSGDYSSRPEKGNFDPKLPFGFFLFKRWKPKIPAHVLSEILSFDRRFVFAGRILV
jgi:hypothetical protein